MTNRKTKTIRKIRPASTIDVLPSQHSPCRTQTPGSKSRNTKHASLHQPSTTDNQPIPRSSAPKSRNGKVARLPHAVRDMINRMLRNNIPHSQIADALGELNFKVTERNISNWKTRGGYRDWCIAQDRALETRLLQDNLLEHLRANDASQLAEVGLQLVATELSQFFLKPETRQQLTTEPEKLARTIGIRCRLARQIHILQKHRDQSAKELGNEHNPEQVKRETDESLESIRDVYSAEKIGDSPGEPHISHRNFLPKNGYPADPPPDPPRDNTEPHLRKFQELCDAIAAQNAAREAEWRKLHNPGSAAPAASSDSSPESEESDDDTPTIDSPSPL